MIRSGSLARLVFGVMVVVVGGCGGDVSFVWEVPERPTRADVVPFGAREEGAQSSVANIELTLNFADGRSNTVFGARTWFAFDEGDDGGDQPTDLLSEIELGRSTDGEGIVALAVEAAASVGYELDPAIVEEWLAVEPDERTYRRPYLGVPVTGWRADDYRIFLVVEDRNLDRFKVEVWFTWPTGKDDVIAPVNGPEFDLERGPSWRGRAE